MVETLILHFESELPEKNEHLCQASRAEDIPLPAVALPASVG